MRRSREIWDAQTRASQKKGQDKKLVKILIKALFSNAVTIIKSMRYYENPSKTRQTTMISIAHYEDCLTFLNLKIEFVDQNHDFRVGRGILNTCHT